MKKILVVLCLALGTSLATSAQINFGLKGGINYNSESIKEATQDVFDGAESKAGYHAGIWLRVKLPIVGFYVRPELVYTNLENNINFNNGTSKTSTTHSFQKLDIPVLFGKKIFGVGNIFVGPSFQYVLNSDFDIDAIKDVDAKGFTVGLQLGAGIELGKLGLDLRWERGFNGIESTLLRNTTNTQVNFDTRVNQIIIGLSYKL